MGAYVYHRLHENPRSLGAPSEVTGKAHKIIDSLSHKANLPQIINTHAKLLASSYINDKMNIKDVTPSGGHNG